MPADTDAASRRIMNQFGDASRIPFLNVEEGDIGVLVACPIVGLFTAALTGIDTLALPFVAAGLGIGVAIVYVAPSHLTAWAWLTDVWRFAKRPRTTYSTPTNTPHPRNEGGLANYTLFAPDERTQDLTNIERAWPGTGTIERTDGAMEAYLELTPGNMDFAMSTDWASLQSIAEDFANNELTFPLRIHTTTRSFPVEQLIEQIDTRLTDEDVTTNPVFRELLEEYRETRPAEMHARGLQEIRYFLGVEVTPLEVYNRYADEQTPAERLTEFPLIGVLFTPFVTRRERLTDDERRAKMVEKLDERVATVRSELVEPASGWSARRLSTVELFVLTMDFWNGEEHTYGDADSVLRTEPVMGHSHRQESHHA
ncbi:hypothetical protein SAMN04487948_10116 [Halogranum amylolyticum]|uniref:Uncharacterized protein n=1 Tax=Halogranum amylolyticum TaxID=660520 RepID=A0A1H8MQH1_9EURY|nr:hypothetical protein [Halogranum amylolyticum]SEO19416.1 hypothetical protein SAMN04487948_10116 [Halogranum amylolyticum]